jgi:hypothetical protein
MVAVTRPDFSGTNRFLVQRRLGAGGMGVVYEAVDRERGARVALKTLRTLDANALLRFKSEFRALQDLQHPNLVSLGELIEDRGQWFFTMELVDGIDFLAWVRPGAISAMADTMDSGTHVPSAPVVPAAGPGYDEKRLRAAMAQLASGLVTLHRAQKIHRDVKPSNIMVTPEGRVVLLDFGLVADADQIRASETQVVGTTAYMAPEQAAAKPVGPEADWYAVGVLLYEALTGRLPFSGKPLEVLMDKQRFEPPPPRALCAEVATDLDALCAELLRFDPNARPAAEEILKRLGVREASQSVGMRAIQMSTQAPPFVGRATELAVLGRAWTDVRAGRTVAVLVHGESGVGKSALVRRFTEDVAAGERRAVVLQGRCYERESVPYKAFDHIVDGLSRFLLRLPKAEAAALLPRQATLLAQAFPVLRRVEAIADAPRPVTDAMDPLEARNRVFAALRELCGRISDRHFLVLAIDDLQWADVDSLALLREITRPPDAPALLLLATQRTSADQNRRSGQHATLLGDVRPLHVRRLPREEARELARTLLATRVAADDRSAAAIADEAEGHPLFIDELVRQVAASGTHVPGVLRLEDALWTRISKLDRITRDVLEAIAVAGAPIAQDLIANAVELDFGEFTKRVSLLRVHNLVRTTGARGSDVVEPYHDRVREAVLAHLEPWRRQARHRRLALAHEMLGRPDAEALATHWRAAGDLEKAGRYAVAAAVDAAQALAFDRAARLYRLALELRGQDAPGVRLLRAELAHALAKAGRGVQAAEAYREAAEGAPPAEALDLRRQAAERLLQSGHVDDGLRVMEGVVGEVGLCLPATAESALRRRAFRRVQLGVRGLRFRATDASHLSGRELARIDVCWSAATGLGLIDPARGSYFQAHHLLSALRSGEPYRVCRALAVEATYSAAGGAGTRKRTTALVEQSRKMAKELDQPHALGLATMAGAFAAYLGGGFKRGRKLAEQAEWILRERCTGVTWELATIQLVQLECLAHLGEVDELLRRHPIALRAAVEHGDLYAATNLRLGSLNMLWLAQHEPDTARREAALAMATWSRDGFQMQHLTDLIAQTNIDLYERKGAVAHERIAAAWPVLHRSPALARTELLRVLLTHLRGRAAVAAALETQSDELLREAETCARTLEREKLPWTGPLAQLLLAAVSNLRGQSDGAQKLLETAARDLDGADLALLAALARRRRGKLIGGEEGAELVAAADRWATRQRIRKPRRMAAMFVPGFVD